MSFIDDIGLIPLPAHVAATGPGWHSGAAAGATPQTDGPFRIVASYLTEEVRRRGHRSDGAARPGLPPVRFRAAAAAGSGGGRAHDLGASLGPEGYRLRIGPGGADIEAETPAGAFYGAQTLLQLLPDELPPGGELSLPGLEIEDRPRFAWRGLHLDVVRHFFPAERIREAIDWCAAHKLNRFHWHLTDDQGWRLPVPSRPRLTEIGAWRTGAAGARHGGSYTSQEIRDLVRHAESRHVVIVPEVEMPGHARAAIAAYPDLSCAGEPLPVPSAWGVFEDVFCAGNDEVFRFLEEVLTETAALFPGPWLHVGGDEVPKQRWLACPRCAARRERERLAGGEELQSWFIDRAARIVRGLGRTLVGWDEILEGGAPADSVVMSWRGFDGGIAAARAGLGAVMCPVAHCYLDSYQGPRDQEPPAFPREVFLDACYAFEPLPPGLDRPDRILGGQACLWTEYIHDWSDVGRMAFPRACAVAEALWTPAAARDYGGFLRRMRRHEGRLRRQGIEPHALPASEAR